MNSREERGLIIAATCRLRIAALCKIDKDPKEGVWIVPSQSGNGKYKVFHDAVRYLLRHRHGAGEVSLPSGWTPEDDAIWQADLQAQRKCEKTRFLEDAEKLRRMWE